MDEKVKVEHLTKKYGDLLVLDDISFSIKKGEFLCIVGPTGCGKTTFLNLLTKIIEPTSGNIYIDGIPADPKVHNISSVFQEPSAFPWLTAEENIEYGLRIKKYDNKYIKEQSSKILALLGLEDYKNVYPRDMSVSMEQRVVIGRAFAMNPDLLLMNEPKKERVNWQSAYSFLQISRQLLKLRSMWAWNARAKFHHLILWKYESS